VKRVILTVLAVGVFALPAICQEQETPPAFPLTHRNEPATSPIEPQSLTVPAEMEVSVQVLSGIHTLVSHVDDLVTAQLMQPVYVDGRVALPMGSLLDGRITVMRAAGRMHKPGELALRFEKITLPDGQARPISGIISGLEKPYPPDLHVDAEGHIIASHRMPWKSLFAGFAGIGTLGAVRAAAVGGATLAKILPIGSAAWIGYALMVPRGREVNVPPETRARVRLNYPVTVRVAW
jgi:hypothetical protein